jgi:predicted RNA-binding Zn-ribbon protein involved in translation (DUF1610 family)
MSHQHKALVRSCVSCLWIFRAPFTTPERSCPKCGQPSYGAHAIYGRKTYAFEATQEPWIEGHLHRRWVELRNEIEATAPKRTATALPLFAGIRSHG